MKRFSQHFQLNKTQAELDFVDIDLEGDTPLYLDPYALTTRDDIWSVRCHQLVVSFFQTVLDAVTKNNRTVGVKLLASLSEPEETRLGVSKGSNKGRGIGTVQAGAIFSALARTTAAQSGLLEDISDFALFIPDIGRDKISDLTTNIIRGELVACTEEQCKLHGAPLTNVASGLYWRPDIANWAQHYANLPVVDGKKVVLVPKHAVRYQVAVNSATFRNKFVLEFLQAEHCHPGDALATVVKNKRGEVTRVKVHKKTVDAHYPEGKDFLAQFAKEHPEVIDRYRDSLKLAGSRIPDINADDFDEKVLATYLLNCLDAVQPGKLDATKYHELMVGIVSFLFFPNLINPKKEDPINDERKRIDITYSNGKVDGWFYRIALDQNMKANIIHVECKNYSVDVNNPEIDQLMGRFDHRRGNVGLLMFRQADKFDNVVARCKDAAKSGRGLILPMDDRFVRDALMNVANGDRNEIDSQVDDLYRSIVS